MPKPKLLIVTKDSLTYSVFAEQLTHFLKDSVDILDYPNHDYSDEIDLVLTSSIKLTPPIIPSRKTVLARRSVSIAKVEQLFDIPDDEHCIVVNNILDKTLESIEQLKVFGFNFRMFPYCPELKVKTIEDIRYAITFAGEEIVPNHITHVFDIGRRPLDISSVIEVAVRLGLQNEQTNISPRYIRRILELTKRHYNSVKKLDELNKQLDGILNTVHDGIISTDSEGYIVQVNSSAKTILGLSQKDDELIGKQIIKLLPGLKDQPDENDIYTLNDKYLVLNRTAISANGKTTWVTAFQDVTKIQQLEQNLRNKMQAKGLSAKYTYKDIIGSSPSITQTVSKLKKIARTDQTIIILGESGTGKEIFAHSIHHLSPRKNGPFLPVNFAGLPESLAESELFGYDEGSFTGARRGGKQGLFELAHQGTIFLDEIGDAPLGLQALLLRVLQERVVMRVGGHKMIPIDVRIVAATNKDLPELVKKGLFREDLYYRLFVLPLRIPPLRERKGDIIRIFDHFVQQYSGENIYVSEEVYEHLIGYHWPGNVRELKSVAQYMVSVKEHPNLTLADLPEQFQVFNPDSGTTQELQASANLKDYQIILEALRTAKINGKKFGRGSIVKHSESQNYKLTDQQVRQRLDNLRQLGLVSVGSRRQGSQITEAGERFLTQSLRCKHL